MATLDAHYLDAFPNWLRSLADDARGLSTVIEAEGNEVVQRRAVAALNYLFKSLDLIPDGLEDLGFLDDAFVLRATAHAVERESEQALSADQSGTWARLSAEAELVQEFLGAAYVRLEQYVAGLGHASVRGRSVNDILSDPAVRADFVNEVRQWADGYVVPGFSRDERNLVKLRAFLLAKLPA